MSGWHERRKLGKIISEPIDRLNGDRSLEQLIFIERDKAAAQRTRAAALMYIGRNDLGLTTSVKENEVWIMKDKDVIGEGFTVDLR